jgi:hypothetical protein
MEAGIEKRASLGNTIECINITAAKMLVVKRSVLLFQMNLRDEKLFLKPVRKLLKKIIGEFPLNMS